MREACKGRGPRTRGCGRNRKLGRFRRAMITRDGLLVAVLAAAAAIMVAGAGRPAVGAAPDPWAPLIEDLKPATTAVFPAVLVDAFVHEPDGRTRVPPAGTSGIAKGVVYLDLTLSDGSRGHCTGTLVGPAVVLTAAHCIKAKQGEPAFTQIRVVPGKDGLSEPLGSQLAQTVIVPEGWVVASDAEDYYLDIGLLVLPDRALTDKAGTSAGKVAALGFGKLRHPQLKPRLTGYPGDCLAAACTGKEPTGPGFGMYLWTEQLDRLIFVTEYFLFDTFDIWGGHSGSAVVATRFDDAIVGVLTRTGPEINLAVRITPPVLDWLVARCKQVVPCALDTVREESSIYWLLAPALARQ